MRRASICSVFSVIFLAAACSAETATQPASQPAPVSMTIGKQAFTLEVANDDESRKQGLMNRESMPEDHGMIFIFDKADRWGFWMKNTLIPLDLLYLSASGKIVDIATLKPKDETNYDPRGAALYVIEINGGVAKKLGLKRGETLTLPEKLPAAK